MIYFYTFQSSCNLANTVIGEEARDKILSRQKELHPASKIMQIDKYRFSCYWDNELTGKRESFLITRTPFNEVQGHKALLDFLQTDLPKAQPLTFPDDPVKPIQPEEPKPHTTTNNPSTETDLNTLSVEDIINYFNSFIETEEDGEVMAQELIQRYTTKAAEELTEVLNYTPKLSGTNYAAYKAAKEEHVTRTESAVNLHNKWKAVKQHFNVQAADQARAAKTLDQLEAAIGEPLTDEEGIIRQAFTYKYMWQDSTTSQTKGLRSHLFANRPTNDSEERKRRLQLIANSRDKEEGRAYYPEEAAEKISISFPLHDISDIFNIMTDGLRSHTTRKEMLEHYAALHNQQDQETEEEPTEDYYNDYPDEEEEPTTTIEAINDYPF